MMFFSQTLDQYFKCCTFRGKRKKYHERLKSLQDFINSLDILQYHQCFKAVLSDTQKFSTFLLLVYTGQETKQIEVKNYLKIFPSALHGIQCNCPKFKGSMKNEFGSSSAEI